MSNTDDKKESKNVTEKTKNYEKPTIETERAMVPTKGTFAAELV